MYEQNIVVKANTNNESILGIFVRFKGNILETQIIREWIDSLEWLYNVLYEEVEDVAWRYGSWHWWMYRPLVLCQPRYNNNSGHQVPLVFRNRKPASFVTAYIYL